MGAAGGFGRRASDGGANLPIFFQKHLEHSDWTMQQQQQEELQQRLQQEHHHPRQSDQWNHLTPIQLNGHSASSQATSPGATNSEIPEDPPNSHDLARYF